jgi:hypothetical protein
MQRLCIFKDPPFLITIILTFLFIFIVSYTYDDDKTKSKVFAQMTYYNQQITK